MKEQDKIQQNRFLVFRIGSSLYGSPLLDVREVVEYQEPKAMPNMVSYFSGVINIRGAIVGVIDLRKKFNEPQDVSKTTAMLVCDTEQGPMAAAVDRVDSVIMIPESDIEKNPPIVTKVQTDFLMGVGKFKDELITLVSLKSFLDGENVVKKAA